MAALALAWLLAVPEVTAVVVGPNTVEHLDPVVEALELRLEPEEHARLGGLFA
jgi:aryl-alcohol dehydrogenase-like predicted oxidoreductase